MHTDCIYGTRVIYYKCSWAEILEFHPAQLEDHLVRPSPSPKFIFKYDTRILPKPVFPSFQPEWSPINLQSAVIIISLIYASF
jgi:hypothetical protein